MGGSRTHEYEAKSLAAADKTSEGASEKAMLM